MAKKKKKLAIFDYGTSKVKLELLPDKLQNSDSEAIESWLVKEGYNLDQIHWMTGPDITLEVRI